MFILHVISDISLSMPRSKSPGGGYNEGRMDITAHVNFHKGSLSIFMLNDRRTLHRPLQCGFIKLIIEHDSISTAISYSEHANGKYVM